MGFPSWLVRLSVTAALVATAFVGGGWKWEIFPH
jgi:hypothetical protein